ncbi:MAG: hypothetical protein Q7S32_03780 [bacterium]|nr:hypothetical protein [bacterium]
MTNLKKIILGGLLLGVVFVAFTFSTSNVEAAQKFGQTCTATQDCEEPWLCIEGVCKKCATDNGCSVDQTCQAGKCVGGSSSDTADDNPLGDFPGEDLSFGDINRIVTGFACWLERVAIGVMIIFLILGGFRFMTAGNDPKAFTAAVGNLKTVMWGILVIFGVYVIIATVANAVGITDFSFIPLVC